MKNFHKCSHRLSLGVVCLLLTFCLSFFNASRPDSVIASEADSLSKTVDNELRNAERLMFNGKNTEADVKLEAAGAMIDDLKTMDPNHKKLKSLESKYERTRKTLDKKLGKTTKSSSERPLPPKPKITEHTSSSPVAAEEQSEAGQAAKLPGGVTKRLKDIDSTLDQVERQLSNNRLKNARYELDKVPGYFAEIDKMYNGQFSTNHPDYQTAQNRYAEMQTKVEAAAEVEAKAEADASKAQEAQETLAKRWVERFAPYISGSYLPAGHNPDKELIFPGTAYPEKIADMQKIYNEAKAVYGEYINTELASSSDLPWQLEQAAKDLKYAMESYESSYQSAMEGFARDAESNIDQALTHLAKTDWKSNPSAVPPLIDQDWKERIASLMKNLDSVLAANDPKLVELKTKYEKMFQQDEEHRKIWQERVRVRPEIYIGSDLDDIRSKAVSIVKEEKPGANILRISVYKDEWKEESVIEPTDSTNTAIRHRITRMINAQVAAKENGEVMLHTLHIAKDKQSNGGWSKLYGHIMYSDKMLESNVNK